MAGSAGGATAGATAAASANKVFKHELPALLCYFMLGCGLLASWNAFLTASDLFNSVFPDRSIDRVFTIVYLPLTLTLVGLVARYPRVLWTAKVRIWTAYTLFTAANAAIPVIDACLICGRAPGSSSYQAAFGLVLAAVALVAVADGLSQGTVFGDAALLPPRYTRAVVMGMSSSGVIIGILRIITKGAGVAGGGLRISTQIYFAAAASITAACLVLYQFVMPRLDVIVYYRGRLAAEQADGGLWRPGVTGKDASAAGYASGGASSMPRSPSADDGHSSPRGTAATSKQCLSAPGVDEEAARLDSEPGASPASGLEPDASPAVRPSWRPILRRNWRLCLAVMCVYVVTLSIFPGFLAEDVHSQALQTWYPVLLIVQYNVFDLGGRCLPTWCPSQTTLLVMSLSRLALVPLYAIAGKGGAGEWVLFSLTALLGATNGWTTALIFMAAPQGLNPSAAELAGMINVFSELAGLNIGAFCGWLWTV